MLKDVPDYQYRQLAEALYSYGFKLDDQNYSLKDFVSATPDKFFYFFTNKSNPNEILVLLVEDYIPGLDYVRRCFNKELDSKSTKLHKVIKADSSADFEERSPVKAAVTYKPPDDWDELRPYAVDFPPYYFGYLATVVPNHTKQFWVELHKRLEQF